MTTQVAFLFPGQGSQAVGMGADVYASSTAAKHVFDTVDAALGFSLSRLCFEGPEETLRQTINAQPAIVTVSLALLAAFQESLVSSDASTSTSVSSSWSSPLTPAFTAGHSVGEYAALVTSGAFDLSDAAVLVRERGRLMHHEGTLCAGSMAAVIGMDAEVLQEVCQQATQETTSAISSPTHPGQGKVAIANYNAPGQIVISGEQQALARASELAKERGAKRVIPLSVSGAFHSPVMEPAARGLAEALRGIEVHNINIPVVGNINARPLTEENDIREELEHQIANSVQWTRTIEYMTGAGVTIFIEIGPGQALTGMVKRIAKGATTLNIGNRSEIEKVVTAVREKGLLSN
ncbi:MAG TPA: [acyl-carrier-protein] S-malonyltransferase, partial [Ktedonobacter sp.]|nr:[acyl-carrier-protein] S-malonyltransferase [Ktedonobacter sp.]